MTNLTILSTAVRTLDNLYSLNDLHKASGGADRHAPYRFMRLEQTQELVAEIELTPDLVLANQVNKGGSNPGTWVCKELVYAYAMWISAKFHLQVIRAFDALTRTPQTKSTTQALPNGLTREQQDAVKALVHSRVDQLPADKRAKAAITCWSALKSKFGCSYKQIEPVHFSEALSLVARLPLEGEYLGAPLVPCQLPLDYLRVMLTIEHGQISRCSALPNSAFVTTPEKLPEQLREMINIHPQQLSDIAEQCLLRLNRLAVRGR